MDAVRLRSVATGVVISVSAEKAARLGRDWEPVDQPKAAPRKRAAAKPAQPVEE
ncbi:DUF7302 family protein [Nocardia niigatensis]